MPKISSVTAASSDSIETVSGRRALAWARTSGSTRSPSAIVKIPIGRLTRKIQRHESVTSRPPNGAPDDAATAATPAQAPTTRLCWRAGKVGSSRPSEAGTMLAAPAAWTTRPSTSTSSEGATAHRTEPAVNTTTPASRNRRRPKWSARRPAGTSRAPNTIA